MIKKILIMLLFTCAFVFTKAQVNLVRNAGFEQYNPCPLDFDEVKFAYYWSCLDSNYNPEDSVPATGYCAPDYVNECSTSPNTSVPINVHFSHYPHSGNGMMQQVMYNSYSGTGIGALNQRDYLQGHLYHSLIAGQSYCVTIYVIMEDGSGYAVNHIGAYLDDGSVDTASNCGLPQ